MLPLCAGEAQPLLVDHVGVEPNPYSLQKRSASIATCPYKTKKAPFLVGPSSSLTCRFLYYGPNIAIPILTAISHDNSCKRRYIGHCLH